MRQEELHRLVIEHQQCSQRIEVLLHKPVLTDDEKIEEVRLKKLSLHLKNEMEQLQLLATTESGSRAEKYTAIEEQITRYAYGEPETPEEELAVRRHLDECSSCAEFVAFVRQSRAVAGRYEAPDSSRAGCPSAEQLRRLQHIGKAEADKLRVHVLNCKWCRAEYLLMSNLVREEIPSHLFDAEEGEPSASRTHIHADDDSPIHKRTAALDQQLGQISERLTKLLHKNFLTADEKLEEMRLKKLKLRLKDQIERIEREFSASPSKGKNLA